MKDPKNVKNSLYLAPLEPLVAKAFRAAWAEAWRIRASDQDMQLRPDWLTLATPE